jgi:hypothetical protein
MTKKPDNIVYSEEDGYNAKLLPYATTVGAPVIKIDDVVNWKEKGIHNVNKDIASKFDELKQEYQKLVKEFQWNELVYSAKFSFEPVVGEIYYVYIGKDGQEFLSLIGPKEWNQEYVATTKLNSERKWVLLHSAESEEK